MDVGSGSTDGDRSGQAALTLPAELGSLRVVGAVVRGWAASIGLSLDEIETLWLAVDEAFSLVVASRPGPETVTIEMTESRQNHQTGVEVAVRSYGGVDPRGLAGPQMTLGRRVLEKLTDEVSFVQTLVGTEIRMSTLVQAADPPE
jgi:anti-sigma regulatory factor (Ser/Thr protein kinase)